MTATRSRARLLTDLGAARSTLLKAVSGLAEEHMSQPGPDGWSIKDHLTHVTFWDEIRYWEIGRVSRGGGPGFAAMDADQTDALNGLIATLRRGLSVGQVMADLEFARSRVLEAIAAAPERALDEEHYGDPAVDGSIAHDAEHAAAIMAWREREGI